MTHRLWLPRIFYEDHEGRGLPAGTVEQRTAGRVLVVCDDDTLTELLSDAEYYAESMRDEDFARDPFGRSICDSAARTVATIRRHVAKEGTR